MALRDKTVAYKGSGGDENYTRRLEARKKIEETYKKVLLRRIQNGTLDVSALQNDLNKYLDDIYNIGDSIVSDYNTRIGYDGYRGDATEWRDSISDKIAQRDAAKENLSKFSERYGVLFDMSGVDGVMKNADKSIESILEYANKDIDRWAQWENEEAYNKWKAETDEYNKYLSYDAKVGQEEIDRLSEYASRAAQIQSDTEHRWTDAQKKKMLSDLSNEYRTKYMGEPKKTVDGLIRDGAVQEVNPTLSRFEDAKTPSIDTINFKSLLDEKIQYHSAATEMQRDYEYYHKELPDLERFASIGINADVDTVGSVGRKVMGGAGAPAAVYDDPDNVRLAATALAIHNGQDGGKFAKRAEVQKYLKELSDDDFTRLAYYIGRDQVEGTNEAATFLKALEKQINLKKGKDIAKGLEGKPLLQRGYGFVAGLDNFVQGLSGIGSNEKKAPSAAQYASQKINEDLGESGLKYYNTKTGEWELIRIFDKTTGQLAYELNNTTANMLPSILASTAVNLVAPGAGAIVGAGLMGASAGGNAKQEMLNLGYDNKTASAYGLMVGASEAGLSYVLSGIPGLRGSDGVFSALGKKVVTKIDHALAKAAITLGADMLDEGLEEGIQTVLEPWFKSLVTGVDFEAPDVDEVLYSSLLGALSAAGFGGGKIAVSKVADTWNAGKIGKSIKNEGNASTYIEKGLSLEGTKAGDIALKLDATKQKRGKVSNVKLGRLAQNMSASQMSAAFQSELGEDSRELSDTLTDIIKGKEVGNKRYASVMKNEKALSLLNEALGTDVKVENSAREARDSVNKALEATTPKDVPTGKISRDRVVKSLSVNLETREAEIFADTIVAIANGEVVSDKKVSDVLQNRFARNALNKYLERSAENKFTAESQVNDVRAAMVEGDYTRKGQAVLYGATFGMKENGIKGLVSVATSTKGDVSQISQAYNAVYQAGKQGKAITEAKNPYLNTLTPIQRNMAYEYGVMDSMLKVAEVADTTLLDEGKIAEEQKKIDNADKLQSRKVGKVIYDGDRTRLSALQRRSLHALETVSEALGVTFHMFESKEVDGKRIAEVNGKKQTANGWYDTKTGEIWIDVNAGVNGDGLIMWTAAHELTHFIKQWSPEKFKIFADFLIENYTIRSISVDELIDRQITKAKKNGRDISRDEALEEVVADSCETFLLDSNAAEKIIELRNEDKSLAQKILDFLKKALRDIKATLKGVQPDSLEGKLVSEMAGTLQQLHDLWADALADASEAYSTTSTVSERFNSENNDIRYSERDFPIDPDVEKTVKDAFIKVNSDMHELGEITSAQNSAINRLVNQTKNDLYRGKFTGGKHKFSSTIIRHIINEHGDFLREALRAQLPMSVTDIARHLSAIKANKTPTSTKASKTKEGKPSILTSYEVNGYTLYAEEITKKLGKNLPGDLLGHTMYKAPTLPTAAFYATSAQTQPKRQSMVLCNYYTPNGKNLSIGNFVQNFEGRPAQLNYVSISGVAKQDPKAGGLIALSSDASNLTDKSGKIEQGYVRCNKPFYITESNRVFSNSDTNVFEKINELKKQGYDCFIFDKTVGDNYMVAVVNKAQIINDEPTVISSGSDNNLHSDRDPDALTNREILANMLDSVAESDRDKAFLDKYKARLAQIDEDKAEIARLKEEKKGAEKLRREVIASKMEKLENGITESEKWLKNLEETATLKRLVSKERDAMYAEAVLAGQMAQGRSDAKVIRKQQEKLDKEKQKRADMLAEYRERVAEREQRIKEKYQESREKAIDGRNKTEMRNKIKGVVSKLHKLLTSDSKEKHVPSGLKTVVADALSMINMDTVDAEKRIKEYNERIAKATDPVVKESLIHTRDEIAAQGMRFAEKIAKLQDAYAQIKNDASAEVRSVYSEDIEEYIKAVREQVGDTSIKDMDIDQLEAVYEMFKIILKNVRDGNKLFLEGRGKTVAENSMAVDLELAEVGIKNKEVSKSGKIFKKFGWSLLKPATFMKVIGSKTFTKLFENIRKGEDTWAVDVNEAKDFFANMRDKYKFDSWDLEKKYDFIDETGSKFSLTVEQIMSLYAYSKRDKADLHLEKGGFVFDSSITVKKKNKLGIPTEYFVNDTNPYRLSKESLKIISSKLTKDMTDFVDEMQAYLSDVMGEKGNEVSMTMYDVRLFKEKNYFPLKTSKYFREFDPEKGGTPKIKNSGFTHKTLPGANNPIVLSNFMDVWANHVNDMAMYHAFTLPVEDFMRVYNYNSRVDGFNAIKQKISKYYGDEANKYIQTLIDQLNGGARSDPDADVLSRGIALFKKAKTFVSASVVIQQPSALARAWAYIDPKYFVDKPQATKHAETWAEVKKYAPVAIIKEMGRFDTNMGRSTADYIMKRNYDTIKDKAKGVFTDKEYRDDVLSKAPALADELAWCAIWRAVKREIAATTDIEVNSAEYFKRCGERFTEIIENTQVYDSVLAKSEIMRSKDSGLKMATAFASEPLTSVNMMINAIVQGQRGRKSFAWRSLGSVMSSVVLNSILVSIVYAARDDDEDETYSEKYLASLTSELVDGFNPLTYIPIVRDAWSVMQGYDIERTDMSMIGDLWKSVEGLFSTKKSGFDKVSDLVGNIAAIFGVPADNVMRDARAIYNVGDLIYNKVANDLSTTKWGVRDAVAESVKNVVPLWSKIETVTGNKRTKYDELYEAMMSGDETYIKRAKSHFDTEELESGIKRGLKDNDVRIEEAAKAYLKGDVRSFGEIIDTIASEGVFDAEIVESVVRSVINEMKPDVETEKTIEVATSIYKAADINLAFENGDTEKALEILSELIEVKTINNEEKLRKKAEEDGKAVSSLEILANAEFDARSSIKSSITSYWKPLYISASKDGNKKEMERIYNILLKTELYGEWYKLEKTLREWLE